MKNISNVNSHNMHFPKVICSISFFLAFFFLAMKVSSQTLPAGFSTVKVVPMDDLTVMAFAPDGRLFICRKNGIVRIYKNDSLLSTPFLTLPVDANYERGICGITFDPNFISNHYLYIYYTAKLPTIHNRLSRFTANGDVVLAGSEFPLLDAELLTQLHHNGGGIGFGDDGKLYLALGDDNNPDNPQNPNSYKGKLLRLNPDGTAPVDNPYISSTSAVTKRIWAYGFRNPFTLAVQPGSGKLFVNDVGEDTWEEINDATAPGLNFGWPNVEGNAFSANFENPFFEYPHASVSGQKGCAITGGAFFNPSSTNYPSLYLGKYFYLDHCSGWMYYLTLGNPVSNTFFGSGLISQNICLQVSPDGNLYYINRSQPGVYKIIYTNLNPPAISSQPLNLTITAGQSATFNVSAAGANPFSYRWQKNSVDITGATNSSYTIANVLQSDTGSYRVIVTNNFGSVTSNPAKLVVTPFNASPHATINSPQSPAYFRAGDIINFSGSASDLEDGVLGASAFEWTVEFWHNNNHFHPGSAIAPGINSGSFPTSNNSHTSAAVFYRLKLKITDSNGLTDTAHVDIFPLTSSLTINSEPQGLQITFGNQSFTTPFSTLTVEGLLINIGVVSPQSLNRQSYAFKNWNNGGSASKIITIGEGDSTFTSVFNNTGPSCTASGTITRDFWANISGTSVTNVPVNSVPTSTSQLTVFEGPTQIADNYGSRIRGYVCPPLTGNYSFWIASDDNSELWLSTNDQPGNKIKIASSQAYTIPREWTKYPSQKSSPVYLIAGVNYYIEAIHKEGSQGDNLAVGWQLPNGVLERPIPGSRLSPYAIPLTVAITSPLNNSSVNAGSDITIQTSISGGTGAIQKVEFFADSTKIGEDGTNPFSLTWNNLIEGNYDLTAKATDSGNNTAVSATVTISVIPIVTCSATGTIAREVWSNVSGSSVSAIPFGINPSLTGQLSIFEAPQNFANNYGQRISGYVCPPVTGNYIFWIASDNSSELWLSTNDTPANKQKIASVSGYTSSRQWTKYSTQKSVSKNLIAGQKYYIEALHKEADQGDNCAVGWQLPSGVLERPIPGNRLSAFQLIPSVELISAGSSWKYLDNGTNQGTNWRTTSFNDATWKTGNAEFGYGDGGEATIVSYGPSSTNKYITTYFRKSFNVTDISTISGLELSLIRDDGAVVYINGVEVYRNNMPSGTIFYNTLAPTIIDASKESVYVIANISSSSLINGTNRIAVEIHQNAVTSPDMSFNLKLKTLSGSRIMDSEITNDTIQQNIILENTVEMIVSPNPNTGQFSLEFCINDLDEKIIVIEVVNSLGKVVYKKQPQKINGCVRETIELQSNLPIGIYIMKVTIEDKIQTAKMLLTR